MPWKPESWSSKLRQGILILTICHGCRQACSQLFLLWHLQGHFEWPPYDSNTLRSAYHLRELEVFRMLQLKRPLDVMLTHDWPDGMAYHGDFQELFRRKNHLKAEVHNLAKRSTWDCPKHHPGTHCICSPALIPDVD